MLTFVIIIPLHFILILSLTYTSLSNDYFLFLLVLKFYTKIIIHFLKFIEGQNVTMQEEAAYIYTVWYNNHMRLLST